MNPKYTEAELKQFVKSNTIPADVTAADLDQAKYDDGQSMLLYAAKFGRLPDKTGIDLLLKDQARILKAWLMDLAFTVKCPEVMQEQFERVMNDAGIQDENRLKEFIQTTNTLCLSFPAWPSPNGIDRLKKIAVAWTEKKLVAIWKSPPPAPQTPTDLSERPL